MQDFATNQSIFIITGMHRSGNSLTASLLQSAGVDIGERLMPPAEGNIKGYFENLDFTEFHENIFTSQGIAKTGWTLEKQIQIPEQFLEKAKLLIQANSCKQYWGWKDPRTTLFLNYWANLIPEANFLLIYRSPWEVIDSLYRRRNVGDEAFDFNPTFALQIWLNYNQEILKFYELAPERCLLLSVSSITHDPNFLIDAIKDKFGVALNYPASDIYDKSLLKTQQFNSHRPALIKHYFPQVWDVYQELNAKALAPEGLSSVLVPELPSLPPYETWVLQDWLELRKIEKESSKLHKQLKQTQEELEKECSQLQQALQQSQAERERSHSDLVQVNSQLQNTQAQLQDTQAQLHQSQVQEQETQEKLEATQEKLEAIQEKLEDTQEKLEATQDKLTALQSLLQQTQYQLEQLRALIISMENTKFWKLRTVWIGLRRSLGLTQDSNSPLRRLFLKLKYFSAVLKVRGIRYSLAKVSQKIYHRLDQSAPPVQVLPELQSATSPADEIYYAWLSKNFPREADLQKMAETLEVFSYKPVISIIMPVFNTPERFLKEAIESVLKQVYPYWELCIADDASTQPHVRTILEEYRVRDNRIKVVFRTENGHISLASNSAIELAEGEFLALLDHDDLLTPDALYEVALLLNRHPEADMIYSDEDKIDDNNQLREPFFKPDWCPDSFLSRMYTCHLGIYRRSLITAIGGFRAGYEGSQDYDLVLRFTEKTEKIFHIPKILYHWRIHAASTASSLNSKTYAVDAAKKALSEAIQRRGEHGVLTPAPGPNGYYLIRYHIQSTDLVSIIIPTKNLGKILDNCLNSIFEKTTYPKYEVILIDNGSTEEETFNVIKQWKDRKPEQFRCYSLDIPFNYSKLNNFAVQNSNGKYLLFLNNDTEVVTPDWIDAMIEQAQRPSIGAVGTLLLYPDNTIQHAGVVAGIGGVGSHSHKHFQVGSPGYFNHINTVNNFSAVTAACLMCRRDVFEEVGGFEEELPVAFNDVDFCFKLVEKGYKNVYLPHVVLYHYESKSRGLEDTPEKLARIIRETIYMQNKWKKIIDNDPCYNPHLTRKAENYSIEI
ncbi:MAG TPA: family 2 glycosyl transferase [Cyanobacteria bacterium UBA8553]|nr:family 2 glycosyl transferase [Cyanobacteria bacterium UBA8553]